MDRAWSRGSRLSLHVKRHASVREALRTAPCRLRYQGETAVTNIRLQGIVADLVADLKRSGPVDVSEKAIAVDLTVPGADQV
jgi:hypothetical protein